MLSKKDTAPTATNNNNNTTTTTTSPTNATSHTTNIFSTTTTTSTMLSPTNNNNNNDQQPTSPHDSGSEGGSSEAAAHETAELLFAVSRGKVKGVTRLLNKGVDVNAKDYDNKTALHIAAGNGNLDLVKLLTSKGANVNAKDRWGHTAIDEALACNHHGVSDYLKSIGGVSGGTTNTGFSTSVVLDPQSSVASLLQASAAGDVEKVKKLLATTEVIADSADYDRRTALHLAASEGRLNVIKLLVELGANVNREDRWGNRCLDDAVRGGFHECADFLRSHGAQESGGDGGASSPFLLKNASSGALAELHRRGVREFWALHADDFEVESTPFAKGAGGEVFHARWRDLECVAKTCGKLSANDSTLVDLGNEIALMATIRHPNIVLFFGACFQVSPPLLLLEYCSGGNLETKMIKASSETATSKDRISFAKKVKYAHDLALGCTFLHKCTVPIIHRDLKPSNVLISSEDTIKVSDFGLAKYYPQKNRFLNDRYSMTGETGSYRYMAPEVFKHEPYNEKVDVYSYALVMYWLFSGFRPFTNIADPVSAVKFAALEGGRPVLSNVKDKRVAALLEKAWAQRPEDRPSFSIIAKFFEELKANPNSSGEGCEVS
jgi:ankyrin repeat protein/tRNA A-37 threonylcarbamoyl transferase component Bud32